MVRLPDGEKIEDVYNRLDRVPACDRQMDRHTFCHGIVRAMHRRHAVKTYEWRCRQCCNHISAAGHQPRSHTTS